MRQHPLCRFSCTTVGVRNRLQDTSVMPGQISQSKQRSLSALLQKQDMLRDIVQPGEGFPILGRGQGVLARSAQTRCSKPGL